MMKWSTIRMLGFTWVVILSGAARLEAATCPAPIQQDGTLWCDEGTGHYTGDILCIAEPVDGPELSTIDEEVVGGGVCVLGKLKTDEDVQRLADFVVEYEMVPPFDATDEEIFNAPWGIFAPGLDMFVDTSDPANPIIVKEFMAVLPLQKEGVFNLSIQVSVLDELDKIQTHTISRKILRVSEPHLTVTNAKVGESTSVGVNEIEGDGDGDGICDEAMPIPGVCSAGPDPTDDNGPAGEPHVIELSIELSPETAKASSIDLCVKSHDEDTNAGSSILIRAVNTITDNSVSPSLETVVESTCAGLGEDICKQLLADDPFCPGGFSVRVLLGHGENQIDLLVNNLATGNDIGVAERIIITPFDVDLRGPALCVRYLNGSDNEIADVDNRVLLAGESDSVLVDVMLGACGSDPETIEDNVPEDCDKENCGDSKVCLQKNGELDSGVPRFMAMCPTEVGGNVHYRARILDPRFPINTATIKAIDDIGNENKEIHSFGYGTVRSLFNDAGNFDPKQAIVPNGLGGFVNGEYVKNELLPVIIKAVNSDKFKNDIFPKLLDPRQPGEEEIACLKSIEDTVNCTFDHLASRDRVVAIKLFCDGDCSDDNVGDIEIPSPYFLNQNRIRVQLKIRGLHGRAEMYTMQFIDSDNDGVVDTEDDDADNDGICDRYVTPFGDCTDDNNDGVCDEEISITGSRGQGLNASAKCVLDKTIQKQDCPDVDAGDEDYFGCSDQDDDNDGVPDDHDLPGRLVHDPDFDMFVLPVEFTVKEMALNLDVQFRKGGDGRLHLSITEAPGVHLIQEVSEVSDQGKFPIVFDCNKSVSQIYGGGGPDVPLNGRNVWVGDAAGGTCRFLETLNPTADGLDETIVKPRVMQSTRKQLICTMNAMARCSIPRRLEAVLDKFEDNKLMAVSAKLLDHRFHMDLYAPLGKADVNVDSRGLGFKAGGLLVPAGISDPDDKAERNATDFLNALPVDFRTEKFGPLSPAFDDEPVDPVEAAFQMGSETNLAVAEETVNSVLHSAGLLLWKLAAVEGDAHQSLDIDAKRLREDFDMGIPESGDPDGICRDKNGNPVDNAGPVDEVTGLHKGFDTYKCFRYALDVSQLFGSDHLSYVDFNGDGVLEPNKDLNVPLMLRASINPLSPPTVRIVSVSPVQTWDGSSSPSRPAIIMAELEIGMGASPMAVYEEQVENWKSEIIRGTGDIRSFCDEDPEHQSTNRPRCRPGEGLMPIARFSTSGRIFVTLLLSVKDKGIIRVEAGLSSREGDSGIVMDGEKTYFNVSVLENNTIVPDQELVTIFQSNVDTILATYLFGHVRDIRLNIPAKLPLEAYCSIYEEASPDLCACVEDPDKDDCDLAHSMQDLWRQLDVGEFGVEGVQLDQTLLGVTSDDLGPRYMTIGVNTCTSQVNMPVDCPR